MTVEPFQIHVEDDVLDVLRHRLSHVQWPDGLDNEDGRYGVRRGLLEPS